MSFLDDLEKLIAQRQEDMPEGSYTSSLFNSGVKRIAQKVAEEGVEVSLASVAGDEKELTNECADLLYHLIVLLKAKHMTLQQVVDELESRFNAN